MTESKDAAAGSGVKEPYGIHILRREVGRSKEPRTGMQVGMPKVLLDANHAEHALAAYDRLTARNRELEAELATNLAREQETVRQLAGAQLALARLQEVERERDDVDLLAKQRLVLTDLTMEFSYKMRKERDSALAREKALREALAEWTHEKVLLDSGELVPCGCTLCAQRDALLDATAVKES